MSAIRDLINKHISELDTTLTKSQYDKLEKGLSQDINAILPPEITDSVTAKERVASSISHITDAGMYDFAEIVLLQQINHIKKSGRFQIGAGQCMACANVRFERDCKIMMPVAITVIETIYPVLSKMVGLQPMKAPVELAKFLRHRESENSDGETRLSIQLITKAIEAGSRKLGARWAIEAVEDLGKMHDVDVYSEVTTALGREIADEIMAEIMGDIYHLGHDAGDSGEELKIEHISDLRQQIFASAKRIGRDTRRGLGNFVVVSPLGLVLLQSDSESMFSGHKPAENERSSAGTVKFVGSLHDEDHVIQVFCNVMDNDNNVIVGYRGEGEADAGYLYCPFILLMTTGIVMDPNTFEPIMTFMTRYSKSVVGEEGASDPDFHQETGRSRNYYESFTIVDDIDFTNLL